MPIYGYRRIHLHFPENIRIQRMHFILKKYIYKRPWKINTGEHTRIFLITRESESPGGRGNSGKSGIPAAVRFFPESTLSLIPFLFGCKSIARTLFTSPDSSCELAINMKSSPLAGGYDCVEGQRVGQSNPHCCPFDDASLNHSI